MSWLRATPDLLEVARAALRENVLPRVAPEGRYDAAMLANALGIAARELAQGAAAREAEHADLGALLGDPAASLDELRARLCREIRSGSLPPAAEPGCVRSCLPRYGAGSRSATRITWPDMTSK